MSNYRLKGASGAAINQSFTLGDRTLIGSAVDCDVRIDSDGAGMQYAEIIEEDGSLILLNLGLPGATLLTVSRLSKPAWSAGMKSVSPTAAGCSRRRG